MSEADGKFGSPDPEDRGRVIATNTPPVEFSKLENSVKQARLSGKPVVYDSTWLVLEALITEVSRLRKIIDKKDS